MKSTSYVTFILIIFFIFKSISFYGQADPNQKSYYKWFDNIMGVGNIGLYDGVEYREEYRTINDSHQFYLSSKFIFGNMVYDGQPYYDVEMKYNIFNDAVIVKIPDLYGHIAIQLISEKIESFSINNLLFIRLSPEDKETISKDNSGFYEISFQSNHLTLLKKHIKIKKAMVDKEFLYHTFKDKNEHFIYANNSFHKIKSKKDVLKLFPAQKKSISAFYNFNRKIFKLNIDQFMIRLAKHINDLMNNNTTAP